MDFVWMDERMRDEWRAGISDGWMDRWRDRSVDG